MGIIEQIQELEQVHEHNEVLRRQVVRLQEELDKKGKDEYYKNTFHKVAFEKFFELLVKHVGERHLKKLNQIKLEAYDHAHKAFGGKGYK